MDDGLASDREELGDQAAVTAPPDGLGTHEAGSRLGQLLGESVLPGLRPHPRGVAAEGGDPDAGELLLARLAGSPAAEFSRMAVRDPGLLERPTERSLVELRVPAGAREAAHVDERLDVRLPEGFHELFQRTNSVANREQGMHTIAALMVRRGRHGCTGHVAAPTRVGRL